MDRRQALTGLTALTALALAGCATIDSQNGLAPAPGPRGSTTPSASPSGAANPTDTPAPPATPAPTPTPTVQPAPHLKKIARPPGALSGLPGKGKLLAWTVDDGVSSDVVAAYAKFAAETGTRITFFPNCMYSSWVNNAKALRPLVESGHVQFGNHTFSHPNLTKLSDAGIVKELQKNAAVLKNTFGVDPAPYYRPPYGYLDKRVQQVASGIGYTAPILWYGSLSDSSVLTTGQIVGFAKKWFLAQHIVIAHANHPAVTKVFPRLLDIIRTRGLTTVTLNDVFIR
ncbi:MAG: polysaccharide deacetylase family protein [Cryobacterium sp.]|nr:polysaccharide deacetylase family protein [Cryobacterium sp.]